MAFAFAARIFSGVRKCHVFTHARQTISLVIENFGDISRRQSIISHFGRERMDDENSRLPHLHTAPTLFLIFLIGVMTLAGMACRAFLEFRRAYITPAGRCAGMPR